MNTSTTLQRHAEELPIVTADSLPPPVGGVFLRARWQALAMLNYRVDPEILQPHVPAGTELDLWQGEAFVSMVGFLFLDTRVLGIPIPLHRHFPEVNLRFYVRRKSAGQWLRGVTFIRELVPRWAIATVAKLAYNEPYSAVPIEYEVPESLVEGTTDPRLSPSVAYRWKFGGRWNSLSAQASGNRQPLANGSAEQFIAEHYFGYCAQRDGRTVEYRVEHPSWNAWQVSEANFDCDVAPLYGEKFAPYLREKPASAFIADGSPVAVYKPRMLKRS